MQSGRINLTCRPCSSLQAHDPRPICSNRPADPLTLACMRTAIEKTCYALCPDITSPGWLQASIISAYTGKLIGPRCIPVS